MHLLVFLILSLFSTGTQSLVGFDCGGNHLNITSVSLLGAGECNLKPEVPTSTEVYIQLLQLSDYEYAEVLQCKIDILRNIYHCGMHSHVSIVKGGMSEYLLETSHTRCLRLFNEGTLAIGNAGDVIDQIRPNQTTTRSITIAGTVNNDGSCKGAQYSDPYGTWDDVVVLALVRITLKSGFVPVKLGSGKIILKSGTICELNDGFCIDSEDGYSFWTPMPTSSCDFHQYDVLYEGPATKITGHETTLNPLIIYSLVTEDITFALSKTKEQPVCGYTLLQTEHPKLFILETKKGETFKKRGIVPVNNLDIFSYVNSKFVYVEKHIRHQMTSLYYNIIQQKCELEKQVITNTLSFATLQPDEFAYRLMKGPGYMAVTAGEAVHVVKCIPVNVLVRKTDTCYLELPVTVRNISLFLTPKSRILTKVGTQRECSYELPTLYRIEDTWVELTPQPHVRQSMPQELKPLTVLSWKYLTPGPLAVSGIYSEKDIEKLRDHIMFPAEKPALLNIMARGITGHTVQDGAVSIYNLLDEESLRKIAESAASRIWNGFITFGSATAGVMGILIVIRLIKFTIDTLIHGYALHSAYGCTLYLFGAVWSSITHLLLHLARGPTRTSKSPPSDLEQGTLLPKPKPSEPTAPIESTRQPTTPINITEQPTIVYHNLNNQLHLIERNPPNTSDSVLK